MGQSLDANGNEKASYSYNAWGKILSATGDMAFVNPLRYRGYYYDDDTGFYYIKSRYYDPQIQRFINADGLASTGQGILGTNMFAYCLNNPVNTTDDTGHWSKLATNLVKVGIGALAIGIGVAATAITGGAVIPVLVTSLKIAATSAAIGAISGAGTNAVKHRISTGSWVGVKTAIINGAFDGAADGFMWGGISAGATFTTVAVKGIRIQQIERLKPSNKPGEGYPGVKYYNQRGSLRSFELHSPHNGGPHQQWHWQQNTWNPRTNSISGKATHWTLFGRRF